MQRSRALREPAVAAAAADMMTIQEITRFSTLFYEMTSPAAEQRARARFEMYTAAVNKRVVSKRERGRRLIYFRNYSGVFICC